jgi:hypothetical protein
MFEFESVAFQRRDSPANVVVAYGVREAIAIRDN